MRNAPMMRAGPTGLRSSLRPGLSGSPSLRPSSPRSGGLIPGRRRTTTERWRGGVGRVNKQLSRATSGRSNTSVPAATSSAARTDGGAAKLDLVDSGQPPARAHARRGPLVRELAGRLRGRAAGPASCVAGERDPGRRLRTALADQDSCPVRPMIGASTVATSTPKGGEDCGTGSETPPAPETRPPEYPPAYSGGRRDRLQRTATLRKTCRASGRVAVTVAQQPRQGGLDFGHRQVCAVI